MCTKALNPGRQAQNVRVVALMLLVICELWGVNEPETHRPLNTNSFEATDILIRIDWA